MARSCAAVLLLAVLALLALLRDASADGGGFLTYDSVRGRAYNVSFDGRSLLLNGERSLFASGAVHYPRLTPAMWPAVAASAKQLGLNMVETYAFWSYHEPVEGELQWQGNADLNSFIQVFADAGLFVMLRIGPYVCAEYDNGGLPSWLGFVPGLRYRECNHPWLAASRYWFRAVVSQLRPLFSAHGGPIVLVQVENELDGASDAYVNWCSAMAQEELSSLAPFVPPVIMSTPSDFGDAAKDTISTCNAADCVAGRFLETRGRNGRVLVDHPALLTELEGGFQVWGESTSNVTSYFFGRAPEDVAYATARWFSRGGSLVNYYMLAGGSNFGSIAGNSITTAYAQNAPVCPDGVPHEPAFSFLTRLHRTLASCAEALLSQPAQLDHGVRLDQEDAALNGFDYGAVAFLENAGDQTRTVRWHDANYSVAAQSILIVDALAGRVLFDSADVSGETLGRRVIEPVAGVELRWDVWSEPLLPSDTADLPSVVQDAPEELVVLTAGLHTDYLWYETNVSSASVAAKDAVLRVTASTSLALVVWLDGEPVSMAENHDHDAARAKVEHVMALNTPFAAGEPRALAILAVTLGGAPNFEFDANSTRMERGILGGVWLGALNLTGSHWRMRPGLAGEYRHAPSGRVPWTPAAALTSVPPGTWLRAQFSTPTLPPVGEGACLLDLAGLGRGRAYVNGHDVGRFWLIPRNDGSGNPSQRFYHVPHDWLRAEELNELVVFEDEGAPNVSSAGIAVSRLERHVLQFGRAEPGARKVMPCEV